MKGEEEGEELLGAQESGHLVGPFGAAELIRFMESQSMEGEEIFLWSEPEDQFPLARNGEGVLSAGESVELFRFASFLESQ